MMTTQTAFELWLARKPKGRAPKKPLPKRTKKRAAEERLYRKLAKAYLKANPRCEVYWSPFTVIPYRMPICQGPATEVHHKQGRIGAKLNEVEHFLAVCPTCHRFIHRNPSTARKAGFLL